MASKNLSFLAVFLLVLDRSNGTQVNLDVRNEGDHTYDQTLARATQEDNIFDVSPSPLLTSSSVSELADAIFGLSAGKKSCKKEGQVCLNSSSCCDGLPCTKLRCGTKLKCATNSVTIHGNFVALARNGDEILAGGVGILKMYKRDSGTWSNNYDFSRFFEFLHVRVSLSGDGNFLIAGEPDLNNDAGVVYVFHKEGGYTWYKKGLTIEGKNQKDYFGYAVDLSDDGKTIAVGAPMIESEGTGNVSVLKLSATGDQWDVFFEKTGADGSRFGNAVSLMADASRMVVGSPHADEPGTEYGSAFFYNLNSGSLSNAGNQTTALVQQTKQNGEKPQDSFGFSVAMSADGMYAVVGSGSNTGGCVNVYKYDGSGKWDPVGERIFGTPGSRFGFSVAITADGNRIAVGAWHDQKGGKDAGSIAIYSVAGNKVSKIEEFEGPATTESGWSVALSRDGKYVASGGRGGANRAYVKFQGLQN